MSNLNILSNWPIHDLSIFEVTERLEGRSVYRLNASMLLESEYHMFFPIPPCEELLIATALEYFTFHPLDLNMNAKYNINAVTCGAIEIFWCSFPKEFIDVCERIATFFGMTMEIIPRTFIGEGNGPTTILHIPKLENVLSFQCDRCNDPDKIYERCTEITDMGNSLQQLGID